jgi:hypothetical protein
MLAPRPAGIVVVVPPVPTTLLPPEGFVAEVPPDGFDDVPPLATPPPGAPPAATAPPVPLPDWPFGAAAVGDEDALSPQPTIKLVSVLLASSDIIRLLKRMDWMDLRRGVRRVATAP